MRAKSLMVLGTASGVGKSVITAAFCRLFSDWGYKVAPFKAQNMSNNSWVTSEGGEIGRAQAVQAECARVEASVHMNPVLLKPAADNRSQVVLRGQAIGHFSARDFYAAKPRLIEAIRESYDKLASEYDVMVLEGAGSPAEVNLKEHDMVNMKMAEWAGASCVLVGDIDRGGVFASLVGTLELLEPHERERISGFIINKFRGDAALLTGGFEFLERKTGKKVWGVLPYERELWIEEEDALALEETLGPSSTSALDIAVVLLPRISNFTDFEILKHEPGVRVRYLKNPADLGRPDLLILPGTKATAADLEYLKSSGFESALRDYARAGGRVFGICGGYQMMGRLILDPGGIESERQSIEGFGFFNMTTEFHAEKILRRVQRTLEIELWGGLVKGRAEGYEIHMGRTLHHEPYPSFGEGGAVHPSGRFAGTYYHGLFEDQNFRSSFLRALAGVSGKSWQESGASRSGAQIRDHHYNRLKNLLLTNLDLPAILNTLGLSVPLGTR